MSMSKSSMEPKLAATSIESCNELVCNVKPEPIQLIDLTLSDKDVADRSKLELNLLDFFQEDSRNKPKSSIKTISQKETDQKRIYYCKYCTSKFSSLQALGGHQNAHKSERALAKNLKNKSAANAMKDIDPLLYAYRGMSRNPNTYALNKPLNLGVQLQSMIHKPYYTHNLLHGRFGYRYHDLIRTNNMNLQAPLVNEMQIGKFQNPGIGVFQQVGDNNIPGAPLGTSFVHNRKSLGIDLNLKL